MINEIESIEFAKKNTNHQVEMNNFDKEESFIEANHDHSSESSFELFESPIWSSLNKRKIKLMRKSLKTTS